MADLKQRLNDDVRTAMRARDKERLGVLRMVAAAIKQKEVDERVDLDDAGVLSVLEKLAKRHRDSIEQYEAAGRQDLADREKFELGVVREFMPQPLTAAELEALIDEAVGEAGASTAKDMGRVMGLLKPRVQGRADMGEVSRLVKSRLG